MRLSPPVRRPCWIFDRADRLSALAERARELTEALRRERCDQFHDADLRSRLSARMAILDARFHRLATCARHDRRMALIRID